METHEIVEHAVEDAPVVHGLLKTARVTTAAAVIFTLIGGAGGAIGMSVRGPKQEIAEVRSSMNLRVDTNAARIGILRHQFDSSLTELRDLKADIKTTTNLACISARARNPEVAKAAGCDERNP